MSTPFNRKYTHHLGPGQTQSNVGPNLFLPAKDGEYLGIKNGDQGNDQ